MAAFVLPMWFAQPVVKPPIPDADVFRFPFTVRNPQFVPLHNVTARCRIDSLTWENGAGVAGCGVDMARPPETLRYDQSAAYPCPVLPSVDTAGIFNANGVQRIDVSFEVTWELHLIPGFPMRSQRVTYYRVRRRVNGTPVWTESSQPFGTSSWEGP